jgi:hypothetical protein
MGTGSVKYADASWSVIISSHAVFATFILVRFHRITPEFLTYWYSSTAGWFTWFGNDTHAIWRPPVCYVHRSTIFATAPDEVCDSFLNVFHPSKGLLKIDTEQLHLNLKLVIDWDVLAEQGRKLVIMPITIIIIIIIEWNCTINTFRHAWYLLTIFYFINYNIINALFRCDFLFLFCMFPIVLSYLCIILMFAVLSV